VNRTDGESFIGKPIHGAARSCHDDMTLPMGMNSMNGLKGKPLAKKSRLMAFLHIRLAR
jgi:hypothetical protein